MSHVVSLDLEIKDVEALSRACKRLGWKLEKAGTYKWYGRWMGDSPIPKDLFETDEEYQRVLALGTEEQAKIMNELLGRCDYKIVIPSCNYEIGVQKRAGEAYHLVWDWYPYGGLHSILGTPKDDYAANPLPQIYGAEKSKMMFEEMGWSWEESCNKQGDLFVKAVKS